MMLRATVVDVDPRDPTRVWVTIPQKYGAKPVRVFTRVQVSKGDHVYVTNTSVTRVPQWVVFGYQTEIGRWGNPYPHTHPMGQVEGLVDALGKKIDRAELDKKADKSTTPTTADVTGQWVSLRSSLGAGWVPSTYDPTLTQQGVEVKRTPSQVLIDVNLAPTTASTVVSTTMATLPTSLRPSRSTWMLMPLQGANSTFGYVIVSYTPSSGSLVIREAPPAGALVRVIGTMVVGL
jgi:hypothetical protein